MSSGKFKLANTKWNAYGIPCIILQLCWIYNQFKIQSLNKITKGNRKDCCRTWLEVTWKGQRSFVGHFQEDVHSRMTGIFLLFPPWAECQESFSWLPTGLKPRYSFWRTQDTSELHPEGLGSQNALLVDGLLPGKVTGRNSLPYIFFVVVVNYCKGLLFCVCVHSFFFFFFLEGGTFFFHFQRYSEDLSCWTVW